VTALIESKLTPVVAREGVIARPRLFARLNKLADRHLTLVSAPAGSGKSVVATSWLAERRDLRPAWVSLDPNDDDPVRLWTYIAHAVNRTQPGVASRAIATLQSPRSSMEEAIDQLLNGMLGINGRVVVVLDDLHHVQDRGGLRLLAGAVERLPPNVRIVATSRSFPGGRFARLRAHRYIGELPARDLAFTSAEAAQLLVRDGGLAIDQDVITLLVERTEGWSAGIGLAGLWLADAQSPQHDIQQLLGNRGPLADYLAAEVLDVVDHRTRDFLVKSSVLERLSPELCAEVLDVPDARQRLRRLAQSNLFVVPLDSHGNWYRYHQLFREFLRAELTRTAPEASLDVHRRAAAWFAEHDLIDEALELLAAIDDSVRIRELLEAQHANLLRTGRADTLITWADRLPAAELANSPVVAGAAAMAVGFLGRPMAQMQRLANIAEIGVESREPREQRYVAAGLAVIRAAVAPNGLSVADARQAVDLARGEGDELLVLALAILAFALFLGGDLAGSRAVAEEALSRPEAPRRPHGYVYANAVYAMLEGEAGRPRVGEASARLAIEDAAQLRLAGTWAAGLAHYALGQCLLRMERYAEAEQALKRAADLQRAPEPRLDYTVTLVALASAHISTGHLTLADTELATVRENLSAFDGSGRLADWLAAVQGQLDSAHDPGSRRIEAPSPAEFAVLRLLATDLTQREISEQLYLSLNTVKTHVKTIYRKLGSSSREDAVRRARVAGLIED